MQRDWSACVGDVKKGREIFGEEMPVQVYRLFEFTLKDVLIKRYGKQVTIEIFREAGFQAGVTFANEKLDVTLAFHEYIKELQSSMKKLKIGILRIEKINEEASEILLSISEDVDCSGLPVTNETVCNYDEGFIKGVLYAYTSKYYDVQEIDCWAKGGRVCRFEAKFEGKVS